MKLKETYERYPDGLTDQEVSDILKLPPGRISARRNDLKKARYNIIEVGRRCNEGSRTSSKVWALRQRKETQSELF
jgi:hypothetical protein